MFKVQVDILSYVYRNNYNISSQLSSTNLRTTPKCTTQLRHHRDVTPVWCHGMACMEFEKLFVNDTSLRVVAPKHQMLQTIKINFAKLLG